jgi:hypothetical protein
MSKKPTRRKKVRRARVASKTFRIVLEAQEMVVSYKPRWFTDMAKFEFRSPHKPPRRIPISGTGYLCHFVPMREVELAESPQDLARAEAKDLFRAQCRRPEDPRQLPLFG